MNSLQLLGIESDADETTVKRAYSRLIKQYRPDTHPAEFADIRHAYEEVMGWLSSSRQREESQCEGQQAVEIESAQENTLALKQETEQVPPQTTPPPVQPARNVIQDLVTQLDQSSLYANEKEILNQYLEQAEFLLSFTLDQQMEYENMLLYWFLTRQNPPLLFFEAANTRYDWIQHRLAIEKSFGMNAGFRLEALQKISTIYSNILKKQNPFLRIENDEFPHKIGISNHHALFLAEELYSLWRQECREVGFEQLYQKLDYRPPSPKQVYWIDIALGFLMAGYGWVLLGGEGGLISWLNAVFVGTIFLILPATCRVAGHWINKKFKGNEFVDDFQKYAILRILILGGMALLLGMISPLASGYLIEFFIAYYFSRWGYGVLSKIESGLFRNGKKLWEAFSTSDHKKNI